MNPAMIDNNTTEFFKYEGQLRVIHKGSISNFEEAPLTAIDLLSEALENDKRAQDGLTLLGIHNPVERLKMFAECRYGSLDEFADFGNNNKNDELVNCSQKNSCPGYGLVCKKKFAVKGEKLTAREVEFGSMLAQGKEIADIATEKFVEQITVWSTLLHIKQKLQLPNYPAVAVFFKTNMLTQ